MTSDRRGSTDELKPAAEPELENVALGRGHRFQATADTAPVDIFHTGANGHVIYVNEEWCRLGGMTPEAADNPQL